METRIRPPTKKNGESSPRKMTREWSWIIISRSQRCACDLCAALCLVEWVNGIGLRASSLSRSLLICEHTHTSSASRIRFSACEHANKLRYAGRMAFAASACIYATQTDIWLRGMTNMHATILYYGCAGCGNFPIIWLKIMLSANSLRTVP